MQFLRSYFLASSSPFYIIYIVIYMCHTRCDLWRKVRQYILYIYTSAGKSNALGFKLFRVYIVRLTEGWVAFIYILYMHMRSRTCDPVWLYGLRKLTRSCFEFRLCAVGLRMHRPNINIMGRQIYIIAKGHTQGGLEFPPAPGPHTLSIEKSSYIILAM